MKHKAIKKHTSISKKRSSFVEGFMLMEMIISMAIFSIAILAIVASFSSGILHRRNSRLIQNDLASARTSMELISKTIRMSRYLHTDNGNLLDTRINMYNNSQDKCVSYRFTVADNLEISEILSPDVDSDCETATYGGWQTLVSGVSGMFQVVETADSPATMGKATVLLNVRENYMQTTISFRDY